MVWGILFLERGNTAETGKQQERLLNTCERSCVSDEQPAELLDCFGQTRWAVSYSMWAQISERWDHILNHTHSHTQLLGWRPGSWGWVTCVRPTSFVQVFCECVMCFIFTRCTGVRIRPLFQVCYLINFSSFPVSSLYLLWDLIAANENWTHCITCC